jgi:opacity protein-like surface antigen
MSLTSNILLRAEYLYHNINNANVTASPGFAPPGISAALVLPPTYTWANYNVQVARVAVSYKF